ncbi:MAG: hypothetical protein U0U46_14670 [Saprospiraceae bacterium]
MRLILLLFSCLCCIHLGAQTDSMFRIPAAELTPTERIVQERQMLRQAFLNNDDQMVNSLLDTLTLVLEDSVLLATYPEERWLLWYWTGNYPRLFDDILAYDQRYRFVQSQKIQPPGDSLIELLDEVSSRSAHLLYQKITAARLSAEETAFATLHVEYLLTPQPTRKEIAEQDENVIAFIKKFPTSRFRHYIRTFLYSDTKMLDQGVDFDVMLFFARPNGHYGAHFRNAFGGSIGVAGWKKRWLYGGRIGIGFQQTRIDFDLDRTDVAADSTGILGFLGAEGGFILMDRGKVRVTPVAGGGMVLLSVPARREIDFAERFTYVNAYGQIGLSVDYRIGNPTDAEEWSNGATGQGAIRLTAGFQWCGLGNNDPALRGNMLFISAGYTFMTRKRYHLPY